MNWIIIALLLLNGCTFKESAEPQQEPQQEAQSAASPSPQPVNTKTAPSQPPAPVVTQSPQISPMAPAVQILEFTELRLSNSKNETVQSRKFSSSKANLTVGTPIGIPTDIAEDLEFELLGNNLKLSATQALSVLLKPKTEHSVKILPTIEGTHTESAIKFKILSSRDIFLKLNDDEVEMEITIAGLSSISTINVTLLRRPRRIETREVERAELLTNPKRFIDLANLKLTLVRALEIKSFDLRPLEAVFRTHLEGKIITQVETASVSQTICGHSQSFSSTVAQIDNDGFAILPIDESTGVELWNDLNNGAFVTGIQPESSRLIGIYAKGEKIRNIIQNGYVKSNFQPISVPASCHARCENAEVPIVQYRMGQDWASQLGIYWGTQGSPAGARACAELSKQSISPKNPFSTGGLNESQVTECALWETTNGRNPWDRERFCASAPPGHPSGFSSKEPWVFQTALMTNALTGTKTNSVAVQLNVKLIDGFVRHIYPKEDLYVPSSRVAPTFTVEFNIAD